MIAVDRSPHLRGSRVRGRPEVPPLRSIPAPAGELRPPSVHAPVARVDPRACRGAAGREYVWMANSGRSPRLRGNPKNTPLASLHFRSIPARAGGAEALFAATAPMIGRSPSVRGSQFSIPLRCSDWGSIPARAGEPKHLFAPKHS